MPPQMVQAQPQAPVQPQQPPPPSPVPGMTAHQVLAGPGPQAQPQAQPQATQFARSSQPQEIVKIRVPWFPIRSNGVHVELEDSIIEFVPEDGILAEGDAQAKVILALFSEVLALRGHLNALASTPQIPPDLLQRVYNLEATLFEQRGALNAQARGVREQIQLFMAQGQTAEQILQSLQGQAQAAAGIAGGVAPQQVVQPQQAVAPPTTEIAPAPAEEPPADSQPPQAPPPTAAPQPTETAQTPDDAPQS